MPKVNRDKILNNLDTNYFVEAGAGSGKTTVLVQRMVNMVKSGIPIEKICAITFTKAAAGEFYERFQKALYDAKCFDALANIDHCFMGTIDSFCNMVLSEHPAESGIPASTEVVMPEDMNKHYLSIFSEYRKQGNNPKLKRFLNYNYNANEVFVEAMAKLMDLRNTEIKVPKIESSFEEYIGEAKAELVLLVDELLSKASHTVKKAEMLESMSSLDFNWDNNFDKFVWTLKQLKQVKLDHKQMPENYITDISKYFVQNVTNTGKETYWYAELDSIFEKINSFKVAVSLDYILDCVEDCAKNLKDKGLLSFFDYQIYLRDLLKNDIIDNEGRLVDYIYNRHSYFLIDEFQDTNPIQAEIFFYLTSKTRDTDWQKCIPHPGSLFIVGDPKQSIYRFRSADVNSYLNVAKLFDNNQVGECINLTNNFRSTNAMCEIFNDMFTELMPKDTENQRAFNPIPKKEKDKQSILSGVYTYNIPYKSRVNQSDDSKVVANIIHTLSKDYDYSDIMVIVRKKDHLKYFMRDLSALNIPFDLRGYVMTDECPALLAISKIMGAIANPNDKIAMYGATHASKVKVSKDDIIEYADKVKNLSPTAVFSKIIEDFEIYKYTGNLYSEYVYFALELLRSSNAYSLKEGASFVKSIANRESGAEVCPQLSQEGNRVLLANLHKVKGLEAPVVILADPYTSDNVVPEARTTDSTSYIFGVSDMTSLDFVQERESEIEALKAEEVRLLYVAATRAEQALIICNIFDNVDKNPWNPLIKNTKDFNIDDAVNTPAKNTMSSEEFYKKTKVNFNSEKENTYHIVRPSDEDREYAESTTSKTDAAHKGTLVHKLMEMLVSSNFKLDTIDSEYRDMLQNVVKTLFNGGYEQVSGAPKDLIKELKDAECYCEVPFCYKQDENIYNGIIDLIYHKDNKWHIIDYKTDSDKNKNHEGQLKNYEKAFKLMTGNDADAKVYHIAIN